MANTRALPISPIVEKLKSLGMIPGARSGYLLAFKVGDTDGVFAKYGVTTPLRVAHFLAQVLHESGGLSVGRENMSYRAPRLMEIFGVNRHSAGVTQVQAKELAGHPQALANRVYGIGNPSKAKELGNTDWNDGWLYRGGGILQTTGKDAYLRYGKAIGVDLVANPDRILDADVALLPALLEWKQSGCNADADRNDIRTITKKINGGFNGYNDRVAWFNKIWPIVAPSGNVDEVWARDPNSTLVVTPPKPAWQVGKENPEIRKLQQALNQLGATPRLNVDGKFGPNTEEALRRFQKDAGIQVDGIPGSTTWSAIDLRLKSFTTPEASAPSASGNTELSVAPEKTGGVLTVLGTVGEKLMSYVETVRDTIGPANSEIIATVLGVMAVVGIGLVVYGLITKQLAVTRPITA